MISGDLKIRIPAPRVRDWRRLTQVG